VGIDVLETTTLILNSLSSPRSLWVLLNRSKCNAFTESITALDVLGRPDSYGWKNLVNKSLFARLADRKWRLSNDINEAGDGRLVYDKDVPQK